tara:strand:- start:302 stop:463 length:162 start_codon:yes stop_codon:yes gene_type:complete
MTAASRLARILLPLALLGVCLTALPACETAKGVGRDLENVGHAIGKAVRNAQD